MAEPRPESAGPQFGTGGERRPAPGSSVYSGRMTSAPGRGVPPSVLLRSLAEGRATTRRMAGELLTHVPDVGNPSTQRLLDAWVE